VKLAMTITFSDHVGPLVCRTRDVSDSGLFLDVDPAMLECSVGAMVHMSVLDDARGEVLELTGEIQRLVARSETQDGGVGVRLVDPPDAWVPLVNRKAGGRRGATVPPTRRLRVLVVGDDDRRRGAMALYVTSGWDVRFASDLATTHEALTGFHVDAVVAEHDLDDPRWPKLLEEVRRQQPMARRVIRASLKGKSPPPSGSAEDLVHCVVDIDAGLDAFVAAITDS
jgi:PilZ domain